MSNGVDMAPLAPTMVDVPEQFRRIGTDVFMGWLGRTAWMVTVDSDGHVEASLSRVDKFKPTDAQVRAFFRLWGRDPGVETRAAKRCRHFVVEPGRPS